MTIVPLSDQSTDLRNSNPAVTPQTAAHLESSYCLPLEFEKIERIISGQHDDPGEVLGRNEVSANGLDLTIICSFVPDADRVYAISPDGSVLQEMKLVHEQGLFRAVCSTEIYGKTQAVIACELKKTIW